jgi:acyl-CoA reductase-like NAD-dependent aldehyde dehydrogenase
LTRRESEKNQTALRPLWWSRTNQGDNVTAPIATPDVVTNPATGERLAALRFHSIRDLEEMPVRSAAAQRKWAKTPRHERSAAMLRYVEVLRAHHEELALILTKDNGKTLDQARAEIDSTIRIFKGFAERILAWHEEARFLDSQAGLEGDVQITHHEPLGVVAAIVPFNFPSELQAWKVAPAIATGNTAVVKPSSLTPLVGTREIELMAEASFPADIAQVIHGSREIGSGLASHPLVAGLSLTGSTDTGISVATAGAKTLKRVGLELGGNDAAIVLADANMEFVVEQAVIGRSIANG